MVDENEAIILAKIYEESPIEMKSYINSKVLEIFTDIGMGVMLCPIAK